jgi:hypothetical protein
MDREVIEVVRGAHDQLLGVYALDADGNRAVSIGEAVTAVDIALRPQDPGRTNIEFLGCKVITTRET